MRDDYHRPMTRRELIFRAGAGFGGLALTGLLSDDGLLAATQERRRNNPLAAKEPQFPARAKSVIFLFMYGGPSHVDLLDPKPELTRNHGKPMTGKGEIDVFFGNPGNLMASPYKFKKHGGCGIEVSELYPNLAGRVDDLCLIRSLYSTSNNHSPAIFHMNSGNMRPGNPSLGSWMTYGLGSFNENLPAYIVMYDWRGGPIGGAPNWSSGFMPAAYQGTLLRGGASPILHLETPPGISAGQQRDTLDFINGLNRAQLRPGEESSELAARIAAYELAFRMQSHAPAVVDISGESAVTRRLYGLDDKTTAEFGARYWPSVDRA